MRIRAPRTLLVLKVYAYLNLSFLRSLRSLDFQRVAGKGALHIRHTWRGRLYETSSAYARLGNVDVHNNMA